MFVIVALLPVKGPAGFDLFRHLSANGRPKARNDITDDNLTSAHLNSCFTAGGVLRGTKVNDTWYRR